MSFSSFDAASAEIRSKRINIGTSSSIFIYILELELLSSLPDQYFKYTTFETTLGMHVRVSELFTHMWKYSSKSTEDWSKKL